MEIKKLYLGHFGKFHNKEIELDSGINVIYGANEAGKSTIHSFIRGMFFGIEKKRGRESREELYTRFQPWEMPGAYQGSMLIEKAGKSFQLSRNFLTKERSYSITDMATGREMSGTGAEKEEFFPHFNELIYRNTISIEQLKTGTDREFAKELQNFIANLSTAQSSEVDIANAMQFLKNKKKELERIDQEASEEEQSRILTLAELQEKVERYDSLSAELDGLIAERQAAEQEFEQRKKGFSGAKTAELSGMMEKYHSYHALETELAADREALEKMDERIRELEEGTDSLSLDADLKKLNHLQEEQKEFERKTDREADVQEERLSRQSRKNRLICAVLAILGLICTIGMAVVSSIAGVSAGIILMLAGGILYLIFAAGLEKKRQSFQEKQQNMMAERLDIESRRKEILVRNYVMDMEALRKKYSLRIAEEAELRQLAERRKDCLGAIRRRSERKAKLFQELKDYAIQFGMEEFAQEELTQDAALRMSEHVSRMRGEEQAAEMEYREQREESLKREERIRWEMSTIAGAAVQIEDISKQRKEGLLLAEGNRKEIEAVELAMNTIRDLSVTIHDSFGEKLNRSISAKVCEITNGKYTEVAMDEQMVVKVLSQNGYLALEKLSAGTNCQIYLAVRLAMAEVFFQEENMPLLFDDAFALYDDDRLKAALSYLADRENQVLLFTCHTREQSTLRQMGLKFKEILL